MGNDLQGMDYEEFGKLRFAQFFRQTEGRQLRTTGSTEVFSIGFACTDGLGAFTYFARPVDSSETAVIKLDFEEDCPEEPGNAFLKWLGLRLHKGMSYSKVKASLGIPVEDFGPTDANTGVTELRYALGLKFKYLVHCFIRRKEGLTRVWIFRKDLVDKFRQWQSSL
jgi:hypothetical protein